MNLVHPKAPITPKQFANMYKENLTNGMSSPAAFDAVFRVCGTRWLFAKDGSVSKFYTQWWEATEGRCLAILERLIDQGIVSVEKATASQLDAFN